MSVCLFVCLLAASRKNYWSDIVKMLPKMYLGTRKNWLNSGRRLPPVLYLWIFCRIPQHCKIRHFSTVFGSYFWKNRSNLRENVTTDVPLDNQVHAEFWNSSRLLIWTAVFALTAVCTLQMLSLLLCCVQVSGFDLLEDEAVVDHHLLAVTDLLPADWVLSDNPGFAYYSYYVYANLVSLNHLRRYVISASLLETQLSGGLVWNTVVLRKDSERQISAFERKQCCDTASLTIRGWYWPCKKYLKKYLHIEVCIIAYFT